MSHVLVYMHAGIVRKDQRNVLFFQNIITYLHYRGHSPGNSAGIPDIMM